jgi:putative ABC transport system permease protein
MTFLEILSESTTTLTVNKMRTGLAVLGIVIGIGSVIALISLGQSSQKSIENQIQSLGSNLLTIIPGGTSSGAVRSALGSGTSLVTADADAIKTSPTITSISKVSPEFTNRGQVTAGRNNANSQVIGATSTYADVHKVTMTTGNFISDQDVTSLARVAVLGPQAATNLFGDPSSAIGQSIRINSQLLTVVGITEAKGGNGFQNPDESIYVPLTTAQKVLFGSDHLSTIAVEAKNADVMTQAQNEIGYLLLDRHHFSTPDQADFVIFSQNDILNTASQVTGTFTTMLGGVAAISLLVGGIGIMNIMLVTVTERTREIGLRQALGARKRIIIQQFLTESVLLTLIGGVIGMFLGVVASYILAKVLQMPFVVNPISVLLALGVSGAIGIIFGWYPARQAAKLQPIEALRYE